MYSTKTIKYFSWDLMRIQGWSTLPHLVCFSRILKSNITFKTILDGNTFFSCFYLMSRVRTLFPWSMRKAWSSERCPFSPTWKYWSAPSLAFKPSSIFLRQDRSLIFTTSLLISLNCVDIVSGAQLNHGRVEAIKILGFTTKVYGHCVNDSSWFTFYWTINEPLP